MLCFDAAHHTAIAYSGLVLHFYKTSVYIVNCRVCMRIASEVMMFYIHIDTADLYTIPTYFRGGHIHILTSL